MKSSTYPLLPLYSQPHVLQENNDPPPPSTPPISKGVSHYVYENFLERTRGERVSNDSRLTRKETSLLYFTKHFTKYSILQRNVTECFRTT